MLIYIKLRKMLATIVARVCDDVRGEVGTYIANMCRATRVMPPLMVELGADDALNTGFKWSLDTACDIDTYEGALRVRYYPQRNGNGAWFFITTYVCRTLQDRSYLLAMLRYPRKKDYTYYQRRKTKVMETTKKRYYVLIEKTLCL